MKDTGEFGRSWIEEGWLLLKKLDILSPRQKPITAESVRRQFNMPAVSQEAKEEAVRQETGF